MSLGIAKYPLRDEIAPSWKLQVEVISFTGLSSAGIQILMKQN